MALTKCIALLEVSGKISLQRPGDIMFLTLQRDAESRVFPYSPTKFQFLQQALPAECRLN